MVQLREVMAALYERSPAALRDAALAYAAAGLPVFPCAPGGKTPLTHNGFHEATTSVRRIRGWWAWQPEANVGIATGQGVDVLEKSHLRRLRILFFHVHLFAAAEQV